MCVFIYLLRNQLDEPLTTNAFDNAHIDRIVNNNFKLNEDIRHLFITVDPSAGKDANFYVLCSTIYTRDGTCVVCSFFSSLSLSLLCHKHISF